MARESSSKYQNPNPGYRKGDEHGGAGGKKRRPADGWEKGDRYRDMDLHQERAPRKPGGKASRS